MRAGVCVCVCVCALLQGTAGAPDTWGRPQPQQTLHGLMSSIDERLHVLEAPKWEGSLRQLEQRLELMETTIRRLDTSIQDRLDKLETNLNSKELKNQLDMEKLSHKLRDISDSSYDRYSRRLGYAEERLEMYLNKVQMNLEGTLNTMEKQQEDIQADVSETVAVLDELKSYSTTADDKLNSTHKAIQQHIQSMMTPSHEALQRISGSLDHLGSRLNNSLPMATWGSQSDGPVGVDIITTIRNTIDTESTRFTNKAHNMYNDLWRRVVSVESLVKDLSRLSNATRHEVMEELHSLIPQDHRDSPGDSQENYLEVALDALERKLQRKLLDLSRKLDDRMDAFSATQNMVMESCFEGGICQGLESRLSQVLERIFDIFSGKIEGYSNRTLDLDELVLEMMNLVKSQHGQLLRTVTHNTNMVVTLAKDSSEASKQLQHSLTQLAGKTEYYFQDLHEDIQDTSNTSGKICSGTNSEEVFMKNKTDHLAVKNVTDIKVVILNTTLLGNTTDKRDHDVGVLKITADHVETLGDNITSSEAESKQSKQNTPNIVDNSLMHVLSIISANLTQDQVDSLLQLLNKSVSVENLEAIIQNTEAEDDEKLDDVERVDFNDIELFNKSFPDDVTHFKGNKYQLTVNITGEVNNISAETEDFFNQTPVSEFLTTKKPNSQSGMLIIVTTEKITNDSKTNLTELPTVLKNQLKIYTLLWKIKNGNITATEIRDEIDRLANKSYEENADVQLLPTVEKICYGEERNQDLPITIDYIDNFMRNRLLHLNQTIDDISLYEKIENLCNTVSEYFIAPISVKSQLVNGTLHQIEQNPFNVTAG